MKNKLWFGLGAAAVLLLSLCTPNVPMVRAQQGPTLTPFNLTAAGQTSAVIRFNASVSSCAVVVDNGGTFTLVPQSTNDGNTWVTATGIDSGSITGTGSYTGGVANTGLYAFRVNLSATDGTAVTGTIACSNSIARVSGGGATGSPGPPGPAVVVTQSPGIIVTLVTSSPANVYQVGVNPGTCLGIVTGALAYTCNTPYPTPTAAPTASPVPSANLLTNLVCTGLVACSPSNGPTPAVAVATPHATNTGCGTLTITYPTFANDTTGCGGSSGPTIVVTPSGDPVTVDTPTPGTFVVGCPNCLNEPTTAPSPPYYCVETGAGKSTHKASGPCVVLWSPYPSPMAAVPTVSPQVGYVAVTRGMFIGPQAQTTPFPSPYPSVNPAFIIYNGSLCEFSNYVFLGPNENVVLNGVNAGLWGGGCVGVGEPFGFAISPHGDFAGESFRPSASGTASGFFLPDGGVIRFQGASSTSQDCNLISTQGGGQYTFNPNSTGNCYIEMGSVPASSALATNSSKQVVDAASLTTQVAELTCGITAPATSCTATATVRAGSKCQATNNLDGVSGTTFANLGAPGVSLSSTTLTVTMWELTTATATLATNYWCP